MKEQQSNYYPRYQNQHTPAIKQWIELFGKEDVLTSAEEISQYSQNVSKFRERDIKAVLRPVSCEQVQSLVRIANQYRIPLYPISTGRNWGMGSKLPVEDACVLVDLSQMQQIVHVDKEKQFIVVEPGVTQQQLYDYLEQHCPEFKFNSTSSGTNTSLIGNILDRGAGNLGARVYDLLNFEVVLGTGDLLETGNHYFIDKSKRKEQPQHYYPHGLGPDLRGLFFQSNFGIVTKAAIRLLPKTDITELSIKFHYNNLNKTINALHGLLNKHVLHGNVRATDGIDPNRKLYPKDKEAIWFAQATVFGSVEMRQAARKAIEENLHPIVEEIDYFDSQIDSDNQADAEAQAYAKARIDLINGKPSNKTLKNIIGNDKLSSSKTECDIDLDSKKKGFLCANAALPFVGESVALSNRIVKECSQRYGMAVASCYATLSNNSLSAFFPIYFDLNNSKEVEQAHQLKDDIIKEHIRHQLYPNRLDVDLMYLLKDYETDSYWQYVKAIKNQLDPNHIISPCRYNIV